MCVCLLCSYYINDHSSKHRIRTSSLLLTGTSHNLLLVSTRVSRVEFGDKWSRSQGQETNCDKRATMAGQASMQSSVVNGVGDALQTELILFEFSLYERTSRNRFEKNNNLKEARKNRNIY